MSTVIEELFSRCFYRSYRTVLRGGAAEPLYQPADSVAGAHRLNYREDYAASALHEVAHWCIAGPQRRRQRDFGYWYLPDGRSPAQQRAFERVEVRPQAIEWHFSLACGLPFRVSSDNLAGAADSDAFADAVRTQAQHYARTALPPRARLFRAALAQYFGGVAAPVAADFRCGR